MTSRIIPSGDIGPIDELLGPIDNLNIVSALRLTQFSHDLLSLYCLRRGLYQFPTSELIEWLRHVIGGRSAIEIGAGNGAIGRALGIPRTDSYVQTTPAMRMVYAMQGQTITDPPADVERLEASEAVAKYQPEVVIGCWVTQRYDESRGDRPGEAQALVGGIDEEWILDQPCVRKYVMVGNVASHGRKRIMSRPHGITRAPRIVSRAHNQSLNRMWTWEK